MSQRLAAALVVCLLLPSISMADPQHDDCDAGFIAFAQQQFPEQWWAPGP